MRAEGDADVSLLSCWVKDSLSYRGKGRREKLGRGKQEDRNWEWHILEAEGWKKKEKKKEIKRQSMDSEKKREWPMESFDLRFASPVNGLAAMTVLYLCSLPLYFWILLNLSFSSPCCADTLESLSNACSSLLSCPCFWLLDLDYCMGCQVFNLIFQQLIIIYI